MTFEVFCGNSSFWNDEVLRSDLPKFTDCFISIIPIWIPAGWFILAFTHDRFVSQKPVPSEIPFRTISIIKTSLCGVLALLQLFLLWSHGYYGYKCRADTEVPRSYFVSCILNIISFITIAAITQFNRRKGVTSSWYLWIYWILTSILFILVIQANFLYQSGCVSSIISYVIFGVYVVQVVLYSLAENPEVQGYQSLENEECPFLRAPLYSKLTFGWFTPIVKKCFKTTVDESDLWDQLPALKSAKNTEDLLSLFNKNQDITKSVHDLSNSLSHNKNNNRSIFEPIVIDEKTSLLQRNVTNYNIQSSSTEPEEPSLYRCCLSLYGFEWLRISLLYLLGELLFMMNPLILREIIKDVQNPEDRGIWYSAILPVLFVIVGVTEMFSFQHSNQLMFHFGLKVKNALIGAIYDKCLRVNNPQKAGHSTGDVLNLVSVDCQRIQDSFPFSQAIISVFFLVGIGLYELWIPMNISFLGCIMAISVIMIFDACFGKLKQRLFTRILNLKGSRVKFINEAMKGIKVIKMYAWEPFFAKKIAAIRLNEIGILRKLTNVISGETVANNLSPFLMNIAMVIMYTFLTDAPYDAGRAFLALTIVTIVNGPLLYMPMVITSMAKVYVSIGRIQTFLLLPEVKSQTQTVTQLVDSDYAIRIENGYFKWDEYSINTTLKGLNVRFDTGKLTAIVGLVGSGKSSLISCILGEITRIEGTVDIKGTIAYISQEAWIQNMTIRDNILYGKQYDEKKYKKVLECCCLAADLKSLPASDMTEIGERGVNLSGGQKQRINIARAVYSNADIYLFDDPLSAVDTHVGRKLFNNVIGPRGILNNKTRILVTHGVQWLPEVENVVVMNYGHIAEQGTFDELVERDGPFAKFLRIYFSLDDRTDDDDETKEMKRKLVQKLDKGISDVMTSDEENLQHSIRFKRRLSSRQDSLNILRSLTFSGSLNKSGTHFEDDGRLVDEEISQTGAVKMKVLLVFLKAMGVSLVITAMVLLCASQTLQVLGTFWLKHWTSDEYLLNSTLMSTDLYYDKKTYYLEIYALLGFLQGLTLFLFDICLLNGFASASSKLHRKMLNSIFRCPLSFFDTTPVGRIINRFSADIDIIDEKFRRFANLFIIMTATLISIIAVIAIETPWSLVVLLPVAVIYVFIIRYYLPTTRQLKRMEAITRSPLYNHFNETITGVSVIRAYRSQERFTAELHERIDMNSTFFFAANTGIGWIGVRIEIFGIMIIFVAALFAVFSPYLNGGDVGLILSYALQIIMCMNAVVQSLSTLQMDAVSIERAEEYTHLEPEASWISTKRPPPRWPNKGIVQFQNYSTRYRPGLDLVLKDVSIDIKSGEKVGIVGRTGAGKSSLSLALFRLIEADGGSISIDGIKIADIGLHDLRSQIAVLPQDPVIFSESLRANLDPKCEFLDSEIWLALEYVHLKEFLVWQSRDLDSEFGENGGNLSVGQRQLLCLARALLHKRKILILDEATAAVDMETDELIQQTIKSQFSDCTILTIAHRINTVLDYDRILVMDKGRVSQFGKPGILMAEKKGLFQMMASEAGIG